MERNEIESLRLSYMDARELCDQLEALGQDWEVRATGIAVGDTVIYRLVFVEPDVIDLTDVVGEGDGFDLSELDLFFSAEPEAGDLIADPVQELVAFFEKKDGIDLTGGIFSLPEFNDR